ncbi:hypothetical protein IMSAG249_02008 [Lachnospiraceae bacterium]|nr:hypothetical protein IMSAG249_02008 [Lachnospiraceae bacterium]
MIHQYKNNGYNIVLDVNSGSVHVVDDVVYDVIPIAVHIVIPNDTDAFPQAYLPKNNIRCQHHVFHEPWIMQILLISLKKLLDCFITNHIPVAHNPCKNRRDMEFFRDSVKIRLFGSYHPFSHIYVYPITKHCRALQAGSL